MKTVVMHKSSETHAILKSLYNYYYYVIFLLLKFNMIISSISNIKATNKNIHSHFLYISQIIRYI